MTAALVFYASKEVDVDALGIYPATELKYKVFLQLFKTQSLAQLEVKSQVVDPFEFIAKSADDVRHGSYHAPINPWSPEEIEALARENEGDSTHKISQSAD